MDRTAAPPPGCTLLITLLDGTVMDARCRGVDRGDLLLLIRDVEPEDGVTVVLRWDHAGEAWEAAGVARSSGESGDAWRVELTQGPVKARCRRHPRVPVHLPVRITAVGPGDDIVAEGVAVDISSGGMRVNLTQASSLRRGDDVEVVLVTDQTVLRCPARIAHTADDRDDSAASEYGIVFCELTPGAVDVVTALVDSALAFPSPRGSPKQ